MVPAPQRPVVPHGPPVRRPPRGPGAKDRTLRPLPRERWDASAPLAAAATIHSHLAFVHSMLEGRQDGVILVDGLAAPTGAIFCSATGFWVALGSPAEFTDDELPEPTDPLWAVYAGTEAWRPALGRHFDTETRRIGYSSDGAAPAPDASVPDRFELRPFDRDLADKLSDGLDPWILGCWDGPEGLAANSFGTAAVRDGEVVAMAVACAIGAGEAELELGTDQRFRRQGLARAVASAFIAQCRDRELEPGWSTAADNEASSRLAEQLGFRPIEDVFGYRSTSRTQG